MLQDVFFAYCEDGRVADDVHDEIAKMLVIPCSKRSYAGWCTLRGGQGFGIIYTRSSPFVDLEAMQLLAHIVKPLTVKDTCTCLANFAHHVSSLAYLVCTLIETTSGQKHSHICKRIVVGHNVVQKGVSFTTYIRQRNLFDMQRRTS